MGLDFAALVDALAHRLVAFGMPLDRLTISFGMLSPSLLAAGVIWRQNQPIEFTRYSYDQRSDGLFERSPLKVASERGGEWLHLDLAAIPDGAFDIVPELKAEGLKHYTVVPLKDSAGEQIFATLATHDPAGFSAADLATIAAIVPTLSLVVEIKTLRSTFREVLGAYVGKGPAGQIINGTIHRGQVMALRSAIAIADLRGFTNMSTQLPPQETADLINRYYDIVVPPIEAAGGEVLKFVGDAVVAIFPVEGRGDDDAVLAALEASRAALDTPIEPVTIGGQILPVHFGLAVHVGDAVFGNVGSGDRLDFTAIGRDVNVAARIAALCSRLGREYLVSQPVADIGRRHGRLMCDAGAHAVRGLNEPVQVYVPDTNTLPKAYDDGISQGLSLAPER
ncbi:MAG: adenylate/guanylate cyclase domain-containing protein [Pseudomonadota bacterium]